MVTDVVVLLYKLLDVPLISREACRLIPELLLILSEVCLIALIILMGPKIHRVIH
jgi:hypothetical protein